MEPKKIKKVVIREDLVAITGDYKKAVILGQFIYWADRVADADKFIQKENEIAAKYGEEGRELLYGWIYKTADELAEEVMLGLSVSQIRRYVSEIVEMGFVDRRKNPNYKWDRTWQYRVNLVNIAKALKKKDYPLSDYRISLPEDNSLNAHKRVFDNEKMEDRTDSNRCAIPYTTTDITNKDYNSEKGVCSFSGEKEFSPSSERGTLSPMVTKAINEAMTEEGENPASGYREELKDITEHFVNEYARTQGKPHKPLTRPAIGNIVYNYLHQDEDEYGIMDDVWTLDQYIPLIDMYMQTNYREGIEKSLSHFMSGSIRRNLKAKLIE